MASQIENSLSPYSLLVLLFPDPPSKRLHDSCVCQKAPNYYMNVYGTSFGQKDGIYSV